MRLSALLSTCLLHGLVLGAKHDYHERLDLRPLPGHHLHADFNFVSTIPRVEYDAHHYGHFPRSLAQILQQTHTEELHLRFALGRWDDEEWGPRPRNGTREGGTGVELWAWIEGRDQEEAEQRWSALVNSLSGHFCASLNFIDGTKTTHPILTFEPEGEHKQDAPLHIMHGLLPREVVCTENLTPFLKMLPCKGKAGVSSLLDGHKLFDASWQSMSIDVRPLCQGLDCSLEIEQSVSMALSIPRSMRSRDNPIPRPVPIEEIECDETKSYNAHDTCYPKPFAGQMAWNLTKVFGRPVRGRCAVDDSTAPSVVTLHTTQDRQVQVDGQEHVTVEVTETLRKYKLTTSNELDLDLPKQDLPLPSLGTSALFASRQLTGYGQQYGGIHTVLRNPHDHDITVVYFESVPWYLRPFMHTLKVAGGTIEKMYYTPHLDRKRGTHLELLLNIPAKSTLTLDYDVEKAILRYTEYPPDANRGFDIGSAIIRVMSAPGQPKSQDQYVRTTVLLLPLPTPDFSMPYNVIILTSTVIALGFGSIFNLIVRRFVLTEEVPPGLLTVLILWLKTKIRALKEKKAKTKQSKETESVTENHARTNGTAALDKPSQSTGAQSSSVNGSTRQRKVP